MTFPWRSSIVVVLAAVLVGACGSDPTPTTPTTPTFPTPPQTHDLYGSWTWIKACCSVGGERLTPDTEGYSLTFVFGSDGRLQVLRNDSPVLTTTYALRQVGTQSDGTPVMGIEYEHEVSVVTAGFPVREQRIWLYGPDILEMVTNCGDCYGQWRFGRVH